MTLAAFPPGMTPAAGANFGLEALHNAANNYCGTLYNLATDTGNAVTVPNPGYTFTVLRLTSGANGGFTITLPSTSSIIAQLMPCATDGSFGIPFQIMNDNVGQIGTLTAGDASTTITGTATVATNTTRDFMLVVTSATTINIYNIGSASL